MSESIIGKLETASEASTPSQDAFRYGILNALDIVLSAKSEDAVRAEGLRFASTTLATLRAPYDAAIALAQAARKAGREEELLVPGATSMDADPKLAAAYADGWAIAQRQGIWPLLTNPTTKERWVGEARRQGFQDAKNQSARLGSGKSWLTRQIAVPVVGTVPGWGAALGVTGLVLLTGYLVSYHKKSAWTIG